MTTNYSNSPAALKTRTAYWMNRAAVCNAKRERYANDSAYRDMMLRNAHAYRANNLEYVRKLDRIRKLLSYHIARGNVERVQQLVVEKRLHQMSKPNRHQPMSHFPTTR